MPVGSVPCERSISALRRFKSWNRTTMTEDRLNGLALLHTHKDKDVDRVIVDSKILWIALNKITHINLNILCS
jgi:hypothetical protein